MTTENHRKHGLHFGWIAVITLSLLVVLSGCPANPFFGLRPNPRDEEGPEVTIINPEEGQTVSGSLIVTGISQDKYAVDSVGLTIDGGSIIELEGTYNWYFVLDTTVLSEGTHEIVVIAEDQFGNVSNTPVNFTVDQTVPTVNPNMDLGQFENYVRGTNTNIEALANDDNGIDRVQISLDGGVTFNELTYNRVEGPNEVWIYSIPDTSTIVPGDGLQVAVLRAYDDTGVLFGTSNFPLWIDNTPPITAISYPYDSTTVDASNDLSANFLPVTGEVNDELVEGLRRVTVEIGTLYTLTSDLGEVTFVDDSPDPGTPGTFDSSQQLQGAEVDEGPLTITVTAEDKAGNTATDVISIALDDNPPSFVGALSTAKGDLDDDLTTSANNFGSGTFTLDGEVALGPTDVPFDSFFGSLTATLVPTGGGTAIFTNQPVDSPPSTASLGTFSHDLVTTGIADGTYDLTLRITNSRGGFVNAIRTLRIDKTGPSASIDDPAAPYEVTGTAVSISGNASANVSDIESIDIDIDYLGTLDGGVFAAPDFAGLSYVNDRYTYTWDTTANYSNGDTPIVTVTVTDLAGNTAVDFITTSIDPTAPTVRFDTYDHPTNAAYTGQPLVAGRSINGSGFVYGTAVDVDEATAGDGTGQVVSITISVDGGAFVDVVAPGLPTNGSVPWNYTLLGISEGTHTITIRVTDDSSASNTSSIQVEVDNTAPTLTNLAADVTDGSGTTYLHGLAQVTGSAADTGAGVETVELEVDDTSDGQGPEALTWDGLNTFTADWDTEALPTDGADPVVAAPETDIELSVTVTDGAGNAVNQTLSKALKPYITSLGKDFAYLGETGLSITGENFTNGTVDPTVTIGDGDIGGLGVTASSSNSITFGIGSDYPPVDPLLSSGPVVVTFNGVDNSEQATLEPDVVKLDLFAVTTIEAARNYYPDAVYNSDEGEIVAAYASQSGPNRYVYYTNGVDAPALVQSATGGGFGQVNIDYYSPTTTTYVSYSRGSVTVEWSTDQFTTAPATFSVPGGATFNDIVVDSTGTAHLVYYDGGALYHRTSADSFATPIQIDGAASDAGMWVTLAVDSTDTLHVAYHNETLNGLMYAYGTYGSGWTTRIVDSSNAGDFGNGIAIDSSEAVHISYYDNNNGDLMYAYAPSAVGTFTTEVVDSSGLTGWFSSISTNAADEAQITYASFSALKPKYARQVPDGSGGFDFEAVTIGEVDDYDINGNDNTTATVMKGTEVHMIYSTTGDALQDAIYLPED